MLKAGRKFPKFGRGSCDILNLNILYEGKHNDVERIPSLSHTHLLTFINDFFTWMYVSSEVGVSGASVESSVISRIFPTEHICQVKNVNYPPSHINNTCTVGSTMADISTFIKRQLFRRNETFLLLLLFVALIFVFLLNQKVGCDVKNDSLPQKAIKTNEQSIPVELETFLFIMILTAPNGKERRDAMRKTWLSNLETLHSSVVPRFVIGIKELSLEDMKNVEEENSRHHDIIFLPELKDAYKDLPSKVLQALKWIDQHANFSYLLKVDDDSFVRLNVILNDLQSTYSMKRLYWGFFRGDAHVKFAGPWAEKNWNLCDRYLPYAQGGGYVLSRDLVNFIARNSDFLQKFNSEDVSVGK